MKNHAKFLPRIRQFSLRSLLLPAVLLVMAVSGAPANAQEEFTRVYPLDAFLTSTLTLSKSSENSRAVGGSQFLSLIHI